MRKKTIKLTKTDFLEKRKQSTIFLSNSGITLTINENGAYCSEKGTEICNFFIRSINVLTLYGTDSVEKGFLFKIEVVTKTLCLRMAISFSELSNSKWITAAGAGLYLTASKHYSRLLQIFNAMLDSDKNKEPAFEATGMHFACGQWIYAASNLLIYPDKLLWTENMYAPFYVGCKISCSECPYRLNSSLEGVEIPDADKQANIITSLISFLLKNVQAALPIFMMNLLSCALSIFSKNGLLVPVVLWITGSPGSGKTQLSMYLGTFYNKPETRNDRQITMNRLRANSSTKLVKARLKNSRDSILLLDDIKAENSTSLREHTNTNADTVIRSVYDQNSEGEPIYCNAIITGEYVPSGESTLARLMLLPLKGFKEVPQNLETLKAFQENGYLVTDFMILFIQWLCQKLGGKSFMEVLQEERSRIMEKYMDFSARNSEMLAAFHLGLHLLEDFCISSAAPSFHEKVHTLVAKGMPCFLELIRNTSFLHGDKSPFYADILSNMILRDKSIRSAPEIMYKGTLNYFNYCAESNESGIYIQNPAVLSDDPYFMDAGHCKPYLLVRQKLLDEFPHELENHCIRHGIPASVYTKYRFSQLADFELILVDYNRSDGSVNQVVKYPSINLEKRKAYTDNFYCVNLCSPLFKKLQRFFDNKPQEKLNVFFEHTEPSFDYDYGNEDCPYDDAETHNLSKYNMISTGYNLKDIKKAFQNIFHYRHTKR